MVGVLFRKTDSVCVAMMGDIKGGDGSSSRISAALALIRAKQRMLYAYVYRPYESPETIDFLRKIADAWTDTILIVNE
jgi:hypothetical protein